MDDLNLCRKTHRYIASLLQTMHTFIEDIRIEFEIQACEVITWKKQKVVKTEGITLSDGKVIKENDDAGYKFLGIL